MHLTLPLTVPLISPLFQASDAQSLQLVLLERGAASLRVEADEARRTMEEAISESQDRAEQVSSLHAQLAALSQRLKALDPKAADRPSGSEPKASIEAEQGATGSGGGRGVGGGGGEGAGSDDDLTSMDNKAGINVNERHKKAMAALRLELREAKVKLAIYSPSPDRHLTICNPVHHSGRTC